ncbi:MAG: Undecaprenyl-phosphate galactose phosphotransferase [Candidatus Woesebacteria bacterium GW2011_GWB1_41_10]|uniref:Undecaprenyl-phosphate galactose phosphotransferase n=1 Tax=Candidatus Woesebacteria bacterium GW2011_GWB1_41_10 TaxID=1618577 RepID=A0A0G0U6D1_9BACT|nr:MAG: Undecaprenyl-phosphate galactose phosphotransferase [Candidatus Woesebacteria bacterium GW2011_GWB1_41_10]
MFYKITKRIIDVVGSILLLVLFSSILLFFAIAIKVSSPGPIFADIPKRVGKDGKRFYPYKFRSMIVNAHSLLRRDPSFRKLYREYKKSSYKLNKDPRITGVGKFIRKHSVDEMPQLFNVLKGEMSIVGPRPYHSDELEEQLDKYPHTKKLLKDVLSVRPGITGFWQVSGRSEVNFDKRIEMDAYYAKKKSIPLDILIMIKTPWVMITGTGAV